MNLESPKVSVQKSPQEVFDFLMNVENFEQIMPDSKEKFEKLSDEKFLFQLKGMPEIVLKQKESTAPTNVVLGAASEKLPFTLTANISDCGDGTSETQLHFEGKFNAMVGMMIKGHIHKFINTLSENIGLI